MFSTENVQPQKISFLWLLFKICVELYSRFWQFLCLQVSIFKQLSVAINAADHEIHHTVLPKTVSFTVSAAVHFIVWVPFLGYQTSVLKITSSLKIQTIVLSTPWHVNSLRQKQKTMALYIGTSHGWKMSKEFRLQFHFCIVFIFQFSYFSPPMKFVFSSFQLHWKLSLLYIS